MMMLLNCYQRSLSAGRPEGYGYWTDIMGGLYRDRVTFDVDFDKVPMRATIAVPGEFRIWHAPSPDVPPNRRECFYLETTGTTATFTTMFEPMPGASEKALLPPEISPLKKNQSSPAEDDPQK